jgi:hypothetical protein
MLCAFCKKQVIDDEGGWGFEFDEDGVLPFAMHMECKEMTDIEQPEEEVWRLDDLV